MVFCKVCGKLIENGLKEFCLDCSKFHKYKYSKKDRTKLRRAYDRWEK